MLYKLWIRTASGSHLFPSKKIEADSIEKATKAFVRYYDKNGVNHNNLKAFVVIPYPDGENPDWDNANGWDHHRFFPLHH